MKKLGICITDLGHSQLSFRLIKEINHLMLNRFDVPISVFYENLEKPLGKLLTGYFNLSESWLFNGSLIATSHTTAQKISIMPGPIQKIYYVQNIDFLNNNAVDYIEFYNIFCKSDLEIWCRSEDHKKILENNFNISVKSVINNFRISEMLEHIREI